MVQDEIVALRPADRHVTFEVGHSLNAEVDVMDLELLHGEKSIIAGAAAQ
jgi:hypothetical protein